MPRPPPPSADEILIGTEAGQRFAAALARGKLVDLILEPIDRPSRVGDIHLGRILRRLPSLKAAFVDIGLPRNGFLPIGGIEPPREGQNAILQIMEDESGGDKGARLNMEVSLPGRFAVLLPGGRGVAFSRRINGAARKQLAEIAANAAPPGHGLILRTEAMEATPEEILADIRLLVAQWAAIEAGARESATPRRLHGEGEAIARLLRHLATPDLQILRVEDAPSFAAACRFADRHMPALRPRIALYAGPAQLLDLHDLAAQIDTTRQRRVQLDNGGAIIIDRTEALTAIDVDTGGDVRGAAADIAMRTNLDAAAEIARQLLLRDIAGLIVIDFVRLKRDDQRAHIQAALKHAVAQDRRPVGVLGWTAAGLMELTRGRAAQAERR